MEFLIFWFVAAVLISMWADSRGRSAFGFFMLAILLSPLLAAIILVIMQDNRKVQAEKEAEILREERVHQQRIQELKALLQKT